MPPTPRLDNEQVKRLSIAKKHLESIKREAAAGIPIDQDLIEQLEKETARLESWADIDERIRDAKQLVRESEALINRTIGSREVNQAVLDQLRINLENLERLKAEIVTQPKD